jgi:putative FmdB family regulatory protein
MPTYEHVCLECNHEWEDDYSIKADPPTVCPSCKFEGKVKRLISGGSGKGKVELTGHEYKEKVMSDATALKREAYRNENVMANLVGESKYHRARSGR